MASERAGAAHMASCSEQLARAHHNAELMTHDWRLGSLRLGGGIYPPGYLPLDSNRCSLHGYLSSLEQPQGLPRLLPLPALTQQSASLYSHQSETSPSLGAMD